jgi:DNA repair protein RadC
LGAGRIVVGPGTAWIKFVSGTGAIVLTFLAGITSHPCKDLKDFIMTTLYVREGENFREAGAQDVLDRAQALIAQRYRPETPVLSAPNRTRDFLRLKLGGREHEVFSVLLWTSGTA